MYVHMCSNNTNDNNTYVLYTYVIIILMYARGAVRPAKRGPADLIRFYSIIFYYIMLLLPYLLGQRGAEGGHRARRLGGRAAEGLVYSIV